MVQRRRGRNPVPLTNFQLEAKLKKLPYYRGIFSHDKLPDSIKLNEIGVINLDKSSGQGTHWVGYANLDQLPYVVYYDSFGIPPPETIAMYLLTSGKPLRYSNHQMQAPTSVLCGAYVYDFLQHVVLSKDPFDALERYTIRPSQNNEARAKTVYDAIAGGPL